MYRFRFPIMVAATLAGAVLAATPAALAAAPSGSRALAATPANIDISQRHLGRGQCARSAVLRGEPGQMGG